MTSQELRKKFIEFFVARGHREIPNVSLVPEHDPTVLFTTAGMHPLVPYLLGETHPQGKRLVNIQRCLRTDDIAEVGDATHNTFFEMMGNWSLGDYWKDKAIGWSFEFLTKELNIPLENLAVSVFAGDNDAPEDHESIEIWKKLGIPQTKIARLSKKDNWWGPIGVTGPCGPDTEMFYWAGKNSAPEKFDPENKNWVEIWNDVFMEYNRREDGKYEPLAQKNVDTGMGLERILMVLQDKESVYETDILAPLMEIISGGNQKSKRIVVDHLRASVFLVGDGVVPGNKDRDYVLRRLIRRGYDNIIGTFDSESGTISITSSQKWEVVEKVILKVIELNAREAQYHYLSENKSHIFSIIKEEVNSYQNLVAAATTTTTLPIEKQISGKKAFELHSTHGWSPTQLRSMGYDFDQKEYETEFRKHQDLSRKSSVGKFAGGLADHSEEVIKGHTATHLLHQALRDTLGDAVHQTGSNITPERIRFDFSFNRKLTHDEIEKVEEIVNQRIKEDLPIHFEIMSIDDAKKTGAIGLFNEKYQGKVKIYSIGQYSKEFCGGPHVDKTSRVGRFTIEKEEALGSGNRRIYAKLS